MAGVAWHKLPSATGTVWWGVEHYVSPVPSDRALCIVHGFRAWHRWGFFPVVAAECAQRGWEAYVLALPSSGYTPSGFCAEQFAAATIAADVRALEIAADQLRQQYRTVAALGHSRGALLTLLCCARFDCVVLWSPPSRFGRWSERQIEHWQRDGELPVGTHPETGEQLRLRRTYWDDLRQGNYTERMLTAARACGKPLHIVVGSADLVTPAAEAEKLAQALGRGSDCIHVISGAGHTFGCSHPCSGATPQLRAALETTLALLDRCSDRR